MSIKQTGPRFVVAALVLLGSFFFVANSASAATYYVRTDGDSTNCTGLSDAAYPGSGSAQVCAWATVAKVNSVTYTAGDMVRFKRGGTWSGTQLSPKSNVTYAATVEDGDKPILTTSATTRTVFLSALQGVTLEDLDVRGGTSAALQINSSGNSTPITLNRIDVSGGGSYQVYIYESVVTATDVDATGENPFYFTTAATPTISTNATFTSSAATRGSDTAVSTGFSLNQSSTLTCTGCVAHNNYLDGFTTNGPSALTCTDCLAYNNGTTTNATSGDGYTSHDTSTLNVRHSIAYGNLKSGVAVTGDSTGEILHSVFYNNVEGTNGSGWDSAGDVGIGINATGNWTVKNNITYGHPVEMMISANTVGAGAVIDSDYNIFYDSLGGNAFDYDGTLSGFAAYQTASSQDQHSLNTDPLFTSIVGNDFTLQSTSPAIDAGVDVNLTSDYVTNPPYDMPSITNTGSVGSYSKAYVDIGAYEYVTPPTPTIESSTHASESTWYNSLTPVTISFASPYTSTTNATTTDFRYVVNQTASPTAAAVRAGTLLDDAITFDAGSLVTTDGTWYVHTVAQNEATTTAFSSSFDTYAVKYDGTAPSATLSSPGDGSSVSTARPTFEWSGSDASSGIASYALYIDSALDTGGIAGSSTASGSDLSCGTHTWYIIVTDSAGNTTTSSSHTFTRTCGGGIPSAGGGGSVNTQSTIPVPPIATSTPTTTSVLSGNDAVRAQLRTLQEHLVVLLQELIKVLIAELQKKGSG